VWNCYQVKAGDTLLSVATSPGSFVADPERLKNFNLDILYGEVALHPGQHLRLPIHNCLEDGYHQCYTVEHANETLSGVSSTFNMTPEALCRANGDTFGRNYCDPAFEPLPGLLAGMELSVSRLHLVQPSPCQEILGSWTCHTVKAKDWLYGIGVALNSTLADLTELNYGTVSAPSCGNCSNVTECPVSLTDKQRGPNCLRIGQVITARVPQVCRPKPGVWKCWNDFHGQASPFSYYLAHYGSPVNYSFFCKANRDLDCGLGSPGLARLQQSTNCFAGGLRKECSSEPWLAVAIKMPQAQCVPNLESYCSNDRSIAGDWGDWRIEFDGLRRMGAWDGNQNLGTDWCWQYDEAGANVSDLEFRIPRGSLPAAPGPYPDTGCGDPTEELVHCTPEPGKHLCHKLLPPIRNQTGYNYLWTDTVSQVATMFGLDTTALCEFNRIKNCSKICYLSALKIPVITPPPAPTPVMYSCNASTGYCAADPRGSLSPGECIANCKCITQHNCGQLNGTVACGADITKCNVCDTCCKPWLTVQASCDGCFDAPPPNGCGGKAAVVPKLIIF
jgi:hypothetical protein